MSTISLLAEIKAVEEPILVFVFIVYIFDNFLQTSNFIIDDNAKAGLVKFLKTHLFFKPFSNVLIKRNKGVIFEQHQNVWFNGGKLFLSSICSFQRLTNYRYITRIILKLFLALLLAHLEFFILVQIIKHYQY